MLHNSFDGTTGAGPTNQRATVPPLRSAARAARGCVSCVLVLVLTYGQIHATIVSISARFVRHEFSHSFDGYVRRSQYLARNKA